jgi:large repetitive protein
VLGNGLVITDGDATPSLTDHSDFGGVAPGGTITRTFTISNSGNLALNLIGTPLVSITGPAAGDFTVVSNPTTPVGGGATTTFQMRFTPSVAGTRAATVTIANNDSDENPYDFAIQGTTCPNLITVQNTNDNGVGSLSQAITDVCNGGTIDFAAGLTGQTIDLTSAELTIAKTVTITNPNAPGLNVSGNNAHRVFNIQPPAVVIISNLSIISGSVTGSGCPTACGGGILINSGATLTLLNSSISGNSVGGSLSSGGGINNFGGVLTVTNTVFSNNSSLNGGGGGLGNSGTLKVVNSTFLSNSTAIGGGGLANGSGGSLTVANSTFAGNSATNGGGLANASFSALLFNNTFSGNSAPSGGAVVNVAGFMTLRNTILANSLGGPDCARFAGTVTDGGGNLVESGASCGFAASNDPRLGPLANYGGSTPTLALLPGSPAIDAGDNAICAAPPVGNLDQRDIARTFGASCDIGAFESRHFSLSLTNGNNQSTPINTGFANPLGISLSSAFGEPVGPGGVISYTAPTSGASITTPTLTATTSAAGAASVSVTANGTPGSYLVTATARGVTPTVTFNLTNLGPEVAVLGNGQVITDGDNTPSLTDHTDFGSTPVDGGAITRTFTISNSGGANLNLTGSPVVSISGAAAGDFSVVTLPATPIAPGTSITFQVRFDPSGVGTQAANVTIANNDSDENPYNFAIQGQGVTPVIQFTQATPYNDPENVGTSLTVSLSRSGDTSLTSTVQVALAGGTALGGGVDYDDSGFPLAVNFGPGVISQSVAVPLVDDALDENTENIAFQVTAVSNAAIGAVNTATLEIVDDDTASILVNPTALTVSEPNSTASFSITLTSQPTATVTILLFPSLPSECSTPASASLDQTTWNTGVTVTVSAVDDSLADGTQTCVIQTTATSSDPVYNNLAAEDITVTVLDDDAPGITVSALTSITTTEAGGTASFKVVLNTRPTTPVTLTLSSGDTSEGIAGPATLVFDSLNWNISQTVMITGQDDALSDGDIAYAINFNPATSPDPNYNGRTPTPASLNLTNLDDDTPGLILTPLTLSITEGLSGTYQIRLSSQPVAPVTLTLSTDGQTGVSPTSLVFTSANWNQPQSVTVTALNDGQNEGAHTGLISHTMTSLDPNYDKLEPLTMTIALNDSGPNPTSNLYYFPLLMQAFNGQPDLIIEELRASSSAITVTVRNIGNGPVNDAFWLDVYFNPSQPPVLNQPWDAIAPKGAVWGVTEPLAPGQSLVLTVGDQFYTAHLSSPLPFPAGATVYGYVDSINFDTNYGNILERNEQNNRFGPTPSISGAAELPLLPQASPPAQELPRR